ncbi:MAG TPA: class F sortase [Actinomycetota bacterium]|nr:class F sortase [Actinomycetota bacterium]
MSGGRRGLLTAIGTVFALSGTTLIVVAMASQERAPQPPPSAAGSLPPASASGSLGPPRSEYDAISTVAEQVLPRSKPVAIDIPVIGVRSSLLSLGLNADGTVQVPSGTSYDRAGWYRYSPTPGSIGPAVILGHVSGDGSASVFFRLGDLRRGNRVMVSRKDGSVAVFEISRVRHYPKNRFPTELVYGNTDDAALRLITCGGLFDSSTGHYVDNIIAFASLVGSR